MINPTHPRACPVGLTAFAPLPEFWRIRQRMGGTAPPRRIPTLHIWSHNSGPKITRRMVTNQQAVSNHPHRPDVDCDDQAQYAAFDESPWNSRNDRGRWISLFQCYNSVDE